MKVKCLFLIVGLLGTFQLWSQTEIQDTLIKKQEHSLVSLPDSSSEKILKGIASFYDNKFEGRKTSTGERFTQKKMTAACNLLPLNHWVKVTNLSNGRSIILRINDRMHPKNKRLIDLSRTAASKLGYLGKGLTTVEVEDLGKKKPAVLK